MKAHLPPWDDEEYVFCRDINGGAGGYLPERDCEQWRGRWQPKQVCVLFWSIRGLTPEEMDARTRR